MKTLLLSLLLSTSCALTAKPRDGWCDVPDGHWLLAFSSPYWATSGQYYLDHDMDVSLKQLLENGFIDCWQMETRSRVIKKVHYRNFRVHEDFDMYEINHEGKFGYVATYVCE